MYQATKKDRLPIQSRSEDNALIQRKAVPPGLDLTASALQRNESGEGNPPVLSNQSGIATYTAQPGPISVQGSGDSHAVHYNDVVQGDVADCYFLASLAGIAKNNPGLIENNIDGPLADGTYNVRLYKRQRRGFRSLIYNVTNEFPSHLGTRLYSKGEDTNSRGQREIWVSLIQKAYAEMLGSYDELAWGWSENAFEALTGQEHSSHSNRGLFGGPNSTNIRDRVMAALQAGKPITASTGSDGDFNSLDASDAQFANNNRIVARHVYTVLNGSDTHVRVRNPWGGRSAEVVMTWAQFKTFFKEFTTRD